MYAGTRRLVHRSATALLIDTLLRRRHRHRHRQNVLYIGPTHFTAMFPVQKLDSHYHVSAPKIDLLMMRMRMMITRILGVRAKHTSWR